MIKLVLGLGNIGRKYRGTRHNVGFEVLDRVADRLKAVPRPRRTEYDWATAQVSPGVNNAGEPIRREIMLVWPRTFMNLSGLAARAVLTENEIRPSEALVVVDDFNLPLGAIRIRSRGSDGGHNGLISLIEELGTEEFPRLRIGIGPLAKDPVVDYVLGAFEPEERKKIDPVLDIAAEAVLFAIDHRLEETMSTYNYNPAPPESA